jgi:DME family drug/metabolite transporter
VFLKEGLGTRVLLALAMGVTGTTLLLIGPRGLGETGDRFLPGTLFALGAGLSYAIYAVTAKRVLAHVHPLQLAALTFGVAALVLSPTLAGQPEVGASVAGGWPLLLYLGLVPTALAYVLFNSGLRHTTATAASIVTLLEPFTATLLGVLLFGERLGVIGGVGAAVLLAAIVTLALGSEQRAAAPLSG